MADAELSYGTMSASSVQPWSKSGFLLNTFSSLQPHLSIQLKGFFYWRGGATVCDRPALCTRCLSCGQWKACDGLDVRQALTIQGWTDTTPKTLLPLNVSMPGKTLPVLLMRYCGQACSVQPKYCSFSQFFVVVVVVYSMCCAYVALISCGGKMKRVLFQQ